jgi:glutaredoxin 3
MCRRLTLSNRKKNPMNSSSETTPVLYTKQGCPWCKKARNILAENNVSYREVSVTQSTEAFAKMQTLSGQSFAPVLDWNGQILSDFGPEELHPFLAQKLVSSAA